MIIYVEILSGSLLIKYISSGGYFSMAACNVRINKYRPTRQKANYFFSISVNGPV